MPKSISIDDSDYFEAVEDDDTLDYFEKIYHKRFSLKQRNDVRKRLDKLREKRELEKLISEDDYDYD